MEFTQGVHFQTRSVEEAFALSALKQQNDQLLEEFASMRDSTEEAITQINSAIDIGWLLLCGALVFFMQAGFGILEAGAIRSKNVANILLKNLLDACIAAIGFYLFGFAFAFGDRDDNPFIGYRFFALNDIDDEDSPGLAFFFFQFSFTAAAATIVAGAMAERTRFRAYLLYSFFISTWVYPVIVHWGWSSTGWLSAFNTTSGEKDPNNCCFLGNGFIDFAGSGVVHMVGGFSALMGAIMLGPRLHRFDREEYRWRAPPGHNILLSGLGCFILWVGWYGFNPGSTLGLSGGLAEVAGRAAVNTTLSAGASGIMATAIGFAAHRYYYVAFVINGVLAGLVSITAGCSVVEPWGAIAIGGVGSGVYFGFSKLLLLAKVDDPVDAFPIHGGCGLWGILAVALFANKSNLEASYGKDDANQWGLFLGGGGLQLAIQCIAACTIIAWVVFWTGLLFLGLRLLGLLRVSEEHEQIGLDRVKHGGAAYPESDGKNRTTSILSPDTL